MTLPSASMPASRRISDAGRYTPRRSSSRDQALAGSVAMAISVTSTTWVSVARRPSRHRYWLCTRYFLWAPGRAQQALRGAYDLNAGPQIGRSPSVQRGIDRLHGCMGEEGRKYSALWVLAAASPPQIPFTGGFDTVVGIKGGKIDSPG